MLKLVLFALFVGLYAHAMPQAYAKGYSPAVTARAGGYEVKFSSSGQPIAVPATGGAIAQVASPFQFSWPNGVDAAGAAVSIFTGAKTAGAWGAAAAAVGVGSMYAIAPLKEWMENAAVMPMNGGGTAIGTPDPRICSVAPCYEWANSGGTLFKTPDLACASNTNPIFSSPRYSVTDVSGTKASCYATFNGSPGAYIGDAYRRLVAPQVGQLVPITIEQAVQLLGPAAPSAAVVQALVDLNFPPEAEKPVITAPPSQFKGNTVQLGLDGTVTEIEERYVASFQPGIINIGVEKKQTVTTPEKKSTTITTNPDGSQSTAVTTTPKTSATITTTAESEKPSSCGLPGSPACTIDESGMPTKTDVELALNKKPSDVQKDIDDILKNPVDFFPKMPTLNWAFALPTGCATLSIAVFAPYLTGIDLCQFQPMFHDLMSVVWMLGGLFGAISLFMKNALSS